ncbi:hypothetical protein ACJ73_03580 [Blastomyces percursus]|uniref:Uncharacterized protein n=1 Tax=Blastomyces percursus TaxID=1658174 RepID=A0A1J9RAN6_9EURO|nr:hypothetical protein ACJ73_03580 [Blastomyces percursus]
MRRAVTARSQRYSPAFFGTVIGWAAEVRAGTLREQGPMGEAIDWEKEKKSRESQRASDTGGRARKASRQRRLQSRGVKVVGVGGRKMRAEREETNNGGVSGGDLSSRTAGDDRSRLGELA